MRAFFLQALQFMRALLEHVGTRHSVSLLPSLLNRPVGYEIK
jgi:hypothetical protein